MFRLRCQRQFVTSFSSKLIKFLKYRVPLEVILLTGNLITGLNTTGIFSTDKVVCCLSAMAINSSDIAVLNENATNSVAPKTPAITRPTGSSAEFAPVHITEEPKGSQTTGLLPYAQMQPPVGRQPLVNLVAYTHIYLSADTKTTVSRSTGFRSAIQFLIRSLNAYNIDSLEIY